MGATRCPFYSRFTESTLHLLLHCHCSRYFWSRVIQRISIWIQAIQESFTYTLYALTKGS
ncbi:hypothetical protein NC653_016842 [Populus alba x Populus x berolinensis]|uniref:Uncharacterized protein n=1 Tax=Populus alba x Populus x berolinensis TaxID=444605 RepID=A0AAD6VZR0_9ROSI|nr:hypothetical protein NC653_016842 [Populus alba x Populus x berolinensis]